MNLLLDKQLKKKSLLVSSKKKAIIKKAVKRAVNEYREAYRLLASE